MYYNEEEEASWIWTIYSWGSESVYLELSINFLFKPSSWHNVGHVSIPDGVMLPVESVYCTMSCTTQSGWDAEAVPGDQHREVFYTCWTSCIVCQRSIAKRGVTNLRNYIYLQNIQGVLVLYHDMPIGDDWWKFNRRLLWILFVVIIICW